MSVTPGESRIEVKGPGRAGRLNRLRALRLRWVDNSRYFPQMLLVPVLVFFVIWNIVPLFWMLGMSFYRYSIITGTPPRFLLFGNYADLFANIAVWLALSKTFIFVLGAVVSETVLGLLLGFLFWGSTTMPGRRLALTLLFTPMILTPAATGTFFRLIYEPTFGVAPHLVHLLFGANINFLGDKAWAMFSVLLVDIWMWTPFMILITLAALGSVPRAELEAAEVDGLPWLKRMTHVILPHAKFIVMLGILLRTIDAFKVMELIYQLTRGGPGSTTEVVGLMLFRRAFEGFDMGWSSALAVVTLLIAIAFTSVYLFILNLSREEKGVA